MEKRIIIFTDEDCQEIGRTEHDSSLIESLPRKGDTILELVALDNNAEKKLTHAVVRFAEFDYVKWIVRIFAEVIRQQ